LLQLLEQRSILATRCVSQLAQKLKNKQTLFLIQFMLAYWCVWIILLL